MAGKRILSKKHDIEQSLAKLSVADPKLADAVICRLKAKEYAVSDHEIDSLISESIWGLSQEISFGWAFTLGFAELIGEVSSECLNRYRDLVRAAGRSGPTLGRIMAAHLVPVVRHGDERLLENFLRVQKIMMGKFIFPEAQTMVLVNWR